MTQISNYVINYSVKSHNFFKGEVINRRIYIEVVNLMLTRKHYHIHISKGIQVKNLLKSVSTPLLSYYKGLNQNRLGTKKKRIYPLFHLMFPTAFTLLISKSGEYASPLYRKSFSQGVDKSFIKV